MTTEKATEKTLNQWSKKELMALPMRAWDAETIYDSVLLVSTGRKHDSGWAMMAIIGIIDRKPTEIAVSCCDDIEWKLPAPIRFGPNMEYTMGQFRTDCALKSGALHAWQRGKKIKVGMALSSTEIELIAAAEAA